MTPLEQFILAAAVATASSPLLLLSARLILGHHVARMEVWRREHWCEEHWCEGCDTIRAEREMAWTIGGLLWRCATCRGIVCAHGYPPQNRCPHCAAKHVDQLSGELLSESHPWRDGGTRPPVNLSQWPVPCE